MTLGCDSTVEANLQRKPQLIAAITEDSDLICSGDLARQLIGRLASGLDPQIDGGRRFYVFSAEKRRMRICLVRT